MQCHRFLTVAILPIQNGGGMRENSLRKQHTSQPESHTITLNITPVNLSDTRATQPLA